jgi:hypothetical protein
MKQDGSFMKNKIFLVIFFILIKTDLALANEKTFEKDPQHKGLLSSVNLGLRYSSVLENRGVILYRDFQIDPVLGLFFYDDRVEFLGDSLGFRDFVAGKWLRLRTRLVSISDDPLFPAKDSVKDGAKNREDTYEWSNRAEFFIPSYDGNYMAEIDVGFSKDISVHNGQYLDLQTKIKLFNFRLPYSSTLIEPNFQTKIGWGDSNHNKYFYGPSADSAGFNNLSYGLWFALPEEADRFYPIIQITHFEVLGQNKNAEFAVDRNSGWLFSFIATYGLFD